MFSAATDALFRSVRYGRPDMLIICPSGPVAALKSWPAARIARALAPFEYVEPKSESSGCGEEQQPANTGSESATFQYVTCFNISPSVGRSPRASSTTIRGANICPVEVEIVCAGESRRCAIV